MSPSRARLVAAVLLAAAVGASDTAHGQAVAGAFTAFLPDNWWRHPSSGSLGIAYDGTVIRIDRDGNGSLEAVFQRPIGEAGIPTAAITSLRLTPTRTIVYAFGGSCGADGTLVYFYRVPPSGDRLTPILTGHCIPHPIDRVSFYDAFNCGTNGTGSVCPASPVSPRRIALFVTPSDSPGAVNLVWIDLTTGAVSGPDFDFATNFGFVDISPSGTHAFVQHDLGLVVPPETDYRLIDLCPGASFGQVVNEGQFPIADSPDLLRAAVSSVAGGSVTIRVATQFGDEERLVAEFDDCLAAVGACCFDSGGCNANLRPAQCPAASATHLGAGTSCSACPAPPVLEACCFADGTPVCSRLAGASCTAQGGTPQPGHPQCTQGLCPQPAPVLGIAGPTAGRIGDRVSYLLDWENTGGATAHDAEIQLPLPSGVTDVLTTGGGDLQGGTVTWTLGEIAGGASGAVGVAFTLGCDTGFVGLQGSIAHTPLGGFAVYNSSPRIDYTVGPLATAPLAVVLATAPARDPLLPGDELTHTITVSNTSGAAVENVRLAPAGQPDAGIAFGAASSFDRVTAAGGGVVDTADGRLHWSGDVAPGSTAIEFVSQIDACIPGTVETTQLDGGAPIAAYDACGGELGRSDAPAAFAVESVVDARIAATNLPPPQRLDAPILHTKVQVTRPADPAHFEVSIGSNTGQAIPGASLQIDLRGFQVTAPPAAPGASYDAGAKRITWTGTVPAGTPLSLDFEGLVTTCRAEVKLRGSSAPGCSDLADDGIVAAVPAPPAGPWLAAIALRPQPFQSGTEAQLVRIDPGPPASVTPVLCLPSEYLSSVGAAPDGTIWMGWLPTVAINPATLDFEAFQLAPLYAAGLDSLSDIAIDPVDGAVYFSGSHTTPGVGTSAILARRDPVSRDLASWYEDDGASSFGAAEVDAAGAVITVVDRRFQSDAVARIEPGTPPVATLFEGVGSPADVALDADGSYLVIDRFGSPAALRDVDPAGGAVDVVSAHLAADFPGTSGWTALTADATGRIFVAPSQAGLGTIDPITGSPQTLIPIDFSQSNVVSDLAMVSQPPVPEPAAGLLASTAIAALCTLRARRRARRSTR